MKKDNSSIFSFFKKKKRKLTEKQQNELALEQARAISDKMAKDKEDIQLLFLQKYCKTQEKETLQRQILYKAKKRRKNNWKLFIT